MAKAKQSAFKLPKRVAGVKIPKIVRKGPLGHFLNSKAGQLVIAETLVAAAAAFTAVKADEGTVAGETVRHPLDTARRVGHALTSAGADESDRLAHAFRAAGRAFREALHDDDYPAWSALDDAAPKSKKKSSNRAESGLH